ncbi:MAG: ABC transporter permease, partial [Rhodothermales bacterium]
MELREVIASAWNSLRANKTRTALTLLGMVIGVFAIITSVTAVKVIEVYFEEKMTFLGTGTFTISRYPSMQMGNRNYEYRPYITSEQVERLKESLDGPLAVSAQEDFAMTTVRFESGTTDPNIALIGTDENFLGNFSYEIAYGRSFTQEDNRFGRRLTVLGASVADELFATQNPLGKVVDIDGNRFTVIGVLEPKGNFLGFNIDNRVFAPMETLLNLYGGAHRNIATTSVRAPAPHMVPAAMDEVIGRFRTIRKVAPGDDND